MVNLKRPANPVHKTGLWPPKAFRKVHVATDTDDWASIARAHNISASELIKFNFNTLVPEEINWYLRELVGCRVPGPKGHNYSFRGADSAKRKIYIPNARSQPAPVPSAKEPSNDPIEALIDEVENSSNPRKARLLCMLSKIQEGGDDRIISWRHIAPLPLSGAPMGVETRGTKPKKNAVDLQWLKDNIKTAADVNRQPTGHGFGLNNRFVVSLKKQITLLRSNLFMVSGLHDNFAKTSLNLQKWANVGVGGSSAMPAEYRAIHQWMRTVMNDKGSVLNCLKTTSAK